MSSKLPKPFIKRDGKMRFFPNTENLKKHTENLPWQVIIKCLCAFLLSRTSLVGGAHPLGFAMFAAQFNGPAAYLYALCSVLGLVFSGAGLLSAGKYIIAIILFALLQERFLPQKYKTAAITSLVAALTVFISGMFLLFTDASFGGYPLIYDCVVLFVECATILIAVRAFCTCIPILFSLKLRHSLTQEQTVSVAFFAGGVLCGFGNAGISGILSVTGTLCVLCVLVFAVRFGSLQGCSAGIIMGTVYCLSRGRIDACAASFALSGLCAGYFSRYGKWWACVSFIITNALVTIFSNGSTEVLINICDTALATIILYCVPKRIFDSLSHFSGYSPPAFELAASRLHTSHSVIRLTETSFRKIFSLRNPSDYNTLLLYRRTAHKTCSGCGLRKYCWGRDIKSTKGALDSLCTAIKNGDDLTVQNAPEHCMRKEQFLFNFEKMYEIYKNDCLWTERVNEFREAVYSSFSSISDILEKCGKKLLSEGECDSAASDDIQYKLRKEGILAHNVFVTGRKENTTVRIKLESCGGFGRCETSVCKVLEQTFNLPFVRTGLRSCNDCWLNYVVKPEFSITTAVASAIKANKKVSGDYVVYALLDRSTYAIILCDGMGSGEIAKEESTASANLLMRLLEAGIDAQTAINLINSMLLCSFSGTLSAIDLCLISLEDGSTSIYKRGGASTYTKTQNDVSLIHSPTLPAGAFAGGNTEVFTMPFEKGSMFVFISDGVASSEKSMPWIKNMINDFEGTEPEVLAQMILKRAKECQNSKPDDDLTVVAAYIG